MSRPHHLDLDRFVELRHYNRRVFNSKITPLELSFARKRYSCGRAERMYVQSLRTRHATDRELPGKGRIAAFSDRELGKFAAPTKFCAFEYDFREFLRSHDLAHSRVASRALGIKLLHGKLYFNARRARIV